MMLKIKASLLTRRITVICCGVFLAIPGFLLAGEEAMTLRINDTMAEPGSRVAVVLRTYAPRGISQGQICFKSNAAFSAGEAPSSPFLSLEEVVVFSETGDAEVVQTFNGTTQETLIEFESLSATINWSDGALAVLFYRLTSAVEPGEEFTLDLDLANTLLFDAAGQVIPVEPRSGVLTVRAPGAPYGLAADGDSVPAGSSAVLGVETGEIFAIGSGAVAVLYDPTFASGPPVVTMDPRHGAAIFSVDTQTPGRVVVSFTSADGSLNSVPGNLVSIALPTSPTLPPGSQSAVTLDPGLTHLEDPAGASIALVLGGDVLDIEDGNVIFADGFESGDFAAWSASP